VVDRESPQLRVIIVSSLGLKNSSGEVLFYNLKFVDFHGWTEADCLAACQEAKFFASVADKFKSVDEAEDTLEEVVSEKYFTAGASARWMFGFDLEGATNELVRYFNRVGDASLLLKGLSGDMSRSAVNHLITSFPDLDAKKRRTCLVSKRAVRYLARFVNMKFIRQAVVIFNSNPTVIGDIFELEFFTILRDCQKEQKRFVLDINETKEEWQVPIVIEFEKASDLSNTKLNLPNHCWLQPTKWNQGMFDALQLVWVLEKKLTIRVVQVTSAAKHDLKFKHLLPFTNALASRDKTYGDFTLDVVVVKPTGKNFQIGQIFSSKPFRWEEKDLRVLSFESLTSQH